MTLVEKAQKMILKFEDGIYYCRTFFDVKEINQKKVEMIAIIDGGPDVVRKKCRTENDINEFIKEYNI